MRRFILALALVVALGVGGGTAVAHHKPNHAGGGAGGGGGGGGCSDGSTNPSGRPCGKPQDPGGGRNECTLGTVGTALVGLGAPEPVGSALADILCGLAEQGIRP